MGDRVSGEETFLLFSPPSLTERNLMINKTDYGFELDLEAIPYVNGWTNVYMRNSVGAWMLRTLSRDLLGVRVGVWMEDRETAYNAYSFRVEMRERGCGEQWAVWSRYSLRVARGNGAYKYKGIYVNSLADALSASGDEINEVLSNIKADIDHLMAFFGATGEQK